MDMDAFVTDVKGYWPRGASTSSASRSTRAAMDQCSASLFAADATASSIAMTGAKCLFAMHGNMIGALFLAASVMLFWA